MTEKIEERMKKVEEHKAKKEAEKKAYQDESNARNKAINDWVASLQLSDAELALFLSMNGNNSIEQMEELKARYEYIKEKVKP